VTPALRFGDRRGPRRRMTLARGLDCFFSRDVSTIDEMVITMRSPPWRWRRSSPIPARRPRQGCPGKLNATQPCRPRESGDPHGASVGRALAANAHRWRHGSPLSRGRQEILSFNTRQWLRNPSQSGIFVTTGATFPGQPCPQPMEGFIGLRQPPAAAAPAPRKAGRRIRGRAARTGMRARRAPAAR
jgi:hypothetical protein